MTGRLTCLLALVGSLSLGLSGCAGTIGLYHSAEGGAIAKPRQAPPGANAPYPNLARVPATPVAVSADQQTAVGQRLAGAPQTGAAAASAGVSAPSPEALAGLELPEAPPPTPNVPDLVIPQPPNGQVALPVMALPAPAPVRPPSAPVALAFSPGSAVLDSDAAVALSGVAAVVGTGSVLVAGFGEADQAGDARAMTLALARARRLADALTADGVPATSINLLAAAGGSGGFVQLFY